MVKSRDAKLTNLRLNNRLTPAVEALFFRCMTIQDLDDAWAPYKETKDSKLSQILLVPGIESAADDMLYRNRLNVEPMSMVNCKYSFNEAFQYLLAEKIGRGDAAVVDEAERCVRLEDVFVTVKRKSGKSLPKGYNISQCKYKQYHSADAINLGYIRDHQVRRSVRPLSRR